MNTEKVADEKPEEKRSWLNTLVVGGLGAFSALYLFNPGAGFIELIPDNIPVIGNLDEAAAAALLISCLAYFGVDLGNLFGRKENKVDGNADVIDIEVTED